MICYRCPLCQQPLHKQDRQYSCPNRHAFDQAKEGYVNLLPVHHKHSKDPGDSAAMLVARRGFLRQGFYASLRDAIATGLQQQPFDSLLDLGTGEGWYAGTLWEQLTFKPIIYGLDIAKAGIKMAAKAYPQCQFAVASNQQLPFEDGCFDWVLNIFAPLHPPEVLRVLAPTGRLLRVSPAPEHLFELKQLLYPQARPHAEKPPAIDGFDLVTASRVQARFTLVQLATLEALIQMTPYGWQARASQPSDLSAFLPLSMGLDVWLEEWRPQKFSR